MRVVQSYFRCLTVRYRRNVARSRLAPKGFATITLAPPFCPRDLLSKHLLHGFAFGEFIHKLVQLADLFHQWIFNILHTDTANHAFN